MAFHTCALGHVCKCPGQVWTAKFKVDEDYQAPALASVDSSRLSARVLILSHSGWQRFWCMGFLKDSLTTQGWG